MSTTENNNYGNFGNDDRWNNNEDRWREEEVPSHRLSDFDEGNETDNFNTTDSDGTGNHLPADDSDRAFDASGENPEQNSGMNDKESREASDRQPQENDDSFYENSYGMGSDSSRSLLSDGNEMVFGNDREGQTQDNQYNAARSENDDWNNESGSNSDRDSGSRG